MLQKTLSRPIVLLIIFIFGLNFLANSLYWYISLWWFDMPMHFLGGVWLGLFFLQFFLKNDVSWGLVVKICASVLLIGTLWEIFEFFFHNELAQNPFNTLDTISDLFFDLSGGTFAFFYFVKRIMLSLANRVQ